MKYFAYGSNMSDRRLAARLADPRKLGVYCLDNHRLAFHKKSLDGSAKCDAYYTGRLDDKIFGVVYEINAADKQKLDEIEGVGAGYQIKTGRVIDETGQPVDVFFYAATQLSQTHRPYDWYHYHVIAGAHEANLPRDYINQIAQCPSVRDPDPTRRQHELNIYAIPQTTCTHDENKPTEQSEHQFNIRRVLPGEELALWQLFFNTIRQINIRDYSQAQVEAWAPESPDKSDWVQRVRGYFPYVLLHDEQILGYADIQSDGYIAHFFCHHQHQGKGIGRLLFNQLQKTAKQKAIKSLYTHASKTAKPFFMKLGFKLVQSQTVQIRGQSLTNFILQKDLSF